MGRAWMSTCLLLLISGYQVGSICTEGMPGFHVPAALIRVYQVERCCGTQLLLPCR